MWQTRKVKRGLKSTPGLMLLIGTISVKYCVQNKRSTNVAQRCSKEHKKHKVLKIKKFFFIVRCHHFKSGKAVKSAMQVAHITVYFNLFPAFPITSFPGYLGAIYN